MSLLCRLGIHRWSYGKRFEDADGVTRSWCTRCNCRMVRDERRRWRAVKQIDASVDQAASTSLTPTAIRADPPIEDATTAVKEEDAIPVEAPRPGKVRLTPEERATRVAEREKKLAAMSPKRRAAVEARQAEKRAARRAAEP